MTAIDEGLLSPLTAGHDEAVSDAEVLDELVTAEVALARAWEAVGVAPAEAVRAIESALGWREGGCRDHGVEVADLAAVAVAGGNPVIPLVGLLKKRVPAHAAGWVHRGATSQDILDSALMRVARGAVVIALARLRSAERLLADFADEHQLDVAAARTLTQHAVPTTIGLRAAGWLRGLRRARQRLESTADGLPAQLGGAGGTLASFVEIGGADAASRLPAAFAAELGLAAPAAPWHVQRWPVTELGDALVQVLDALGKLATDVATLSRTEIGELAEGAGGGSSAMPQKQNPVAAVLVRSAAIRAPQLGATLHLAAALAVDERPDGSWHAEWPTLRELLRLALGASAHTAALVGGLRVDSDAVARNLVLTGGLIVSERLGIVLKPLIGAERFDAIIAEASAGADLGELVRALPEAPRLDVDSLLDPAGYTGLAGVLVDEVTTQAASTMPAESASTSSISPESLPEERP